MGHRDSGARGALPGTGRRYWVRGAFPGRGKALLDAESFSWMREGVTGCRELFLAVALSCSCLRLFCSCLRV